MMKGLWQAPWLAILMMPQVYAYTGFDICNFGKVKMPSVICYGPAVLKQTSISGDMKVAGPLTADSITVNAMAIDGAVQLKNSTVNGLVMAKGTFFADHVVFRKPLTLTADSVTLNHTTVKGSVSITSSEDTTPYLIVVCGSVVTGGVSFDNKAGIIQITGDSIVQGKIKNGAMEFIKKDCS